MAGENPAERRQAKRLPLNLPLRLKWSRRGAPVQELGTVRDISPVGVYFLLSHDLKPKGKLEFFVPLQLEGAPEGGVLMHCTGRASASPLRLIATACSLWVKLPRTPPPASLPTSLFPPNPGPVRPIRSWAVD
jgi:hypothetical protein